MIKALPHPYLVPFDQRFSIPKAPTTPPLDTPSDKKLKKKLMSISEELYGLQRTLYAHNRYSVLLVFQAMDAAGKDSTIRHVLRGVNPAGCQVHSFKKPSSEELEHDFLWRSATRLPERGRIGVFNRSYYEESLVVRVHPEYLNGQNLPHPIDLNTIWEERYRSIADHEAHLARNGTVIIKFWLNVSRQEQKNRFLARLDRPEKNWKFNSADIDERQHWDEYMDAYEDVLSATSREYAPWYAIPADNKRWMRVQVAEIIRDTLKSMPLHYPEAKDKERALFDDLRLQLQNEDD